MKIFRTKVFKILDCLIHGRGMLRVNWDREYGPSDIYINKCTVLWIEWGKAWWLKFYLLHGVYNLFEKQCGCTKNITMNPHTPVKCQIPASPDSHIHVYLPTQVNIYIYCISYYIWYAPICHFTQFLKNQS